MEDTYLIILFLVMWYFLIFFACLFLISGIDDLFFDIYYWSRYFIRKWKTRKYKPLTYEDLVNQPEKYVAVLVACWHEANVIATMLMNNCYAIDYTNYYLFVGVYPNDPETVAEVQRVQSYIKNVQCVIGPEPGPTTKAANLNGIYNHIKEFEKTLGIEFDIFVFHDSEDVIHPLSFKLYNYLIPRKDMIQIPMFPLEVNYWNFTHWVYADEFAEIHTKDLIVREAIHGHVPSAGVGTAFSKQALLAIEDPITKGPFSIDSLTEDYRTSLTLRIKGLKQIFLVQSIERLKWEQKGFFNKYYVLKRKKEYIATRALFPTEYQKAVRQKARWIIGIVFQEWVHTKWPKVWRVRFTLAHDRKAFITHFINGLGYVVFLFWIVYSLLTFNNPVYPSLQEQLNLYPWVWVLVIISTLLMLERMLQRFIGLYRVYSLIPAWLSIPRAFYGNILNLHAILRAYKLYFLATAPKKSAKSTARQPVWDKTDHVFPGSHILTPYRRRLGDILVEEKIISFAQLKQAILEQQKSGERLGKVLARLNFVDEKKLLKIIANQYNLELVSKEKIITAPKTFSSKLSKWLEGKGSYLVDYNETAEQVTIGITDPTNELLIESIIEKFNPLKTQFVLIDLSD
ncbi:glycosyltransferase [Legionella gresilensis]|uniref:glycosyltransferase n=1 Tax=Legionella gresilensis TaxID=91823 RepID=UPI001040FED8|nr:glycosyltransferase [Legionella gresilensis]